MTNAETFARIRYWIDEINKYCQESIVKVLVGNKDDSKRLEKSSEACKVISTEQAQSFARAMELTFFETSAKENKNVDAVFYAATRLALQRRLQNLDARPSLRSNIALNQQQQQTSRSKKRFDDCCH